MSVAPGVVPPEYRLPPTAHIGRVRLQVSDIERSLSFYRRVLGFEVLSRDAARARLGVAGDTQSLIELDERPGVRPVPRRGLLGLFHFSILLPNREALGSLVMHLTNVQVRVGSADHGVSEALYLTDPDGLGIEVYADRPRASWAIRDLEVAMITIPLDLGNLAAAATTPWSGMPAGTVIGHVHFSVGDLAQAEAFYHLALGFDKVAWSYPGALFLSAGGYHHHVGTNIWAMGATPATASDARLIDWQLRLPHASDVKAVATHAASKGYSARQPDASVPNEVSLLVTDPWGISVLLSGNTAE